MSVTVSNGGGRSVATASELTAASVPGVAEQRDVTGGSIGGLKRYLRRNPSLAIGIALLLSLLLFSGIGALAYDTSRARALSVPPGMPPSGYYPFGTDSTGRDLFAVMILGTPMTLRIGLIAGVIGVTIGTVLAFVSAYYGGLLDTLIRGVVDVLLTVPGLMLLVILAVMVKSSLTVDQMALVVASLAWLWPTRTIRAQALTLRERAYIQVAKLSGVSGPEIIFKEMLPNLLPYLGASLVASTAAAVLASIGLEALGLGPMEAPTIGMTFYWVIFHSALLHGMWWWFTPPLVIIIILFLGLFCLSAGLDEIANPRLRQEV
jgi:peptide/nickel transport system permease protein